jgi:hypothetical protein
MDKYSCEIQTDKNKCLKELEKKQFELNKKLIFNNYTENNITVNITEEMDISKMSKIDLLAKCKELGITRYSSKNKPQLLELINNKTNNNTEDQTNILTSKSVNSLIVNEPITETLNVIDLFCGCGGMSKG